MNMMTEISLETINNGAASELFKRELEVIAKNINDINTSSKDKRKLTLTFTFSPDEDRREVIVSVGAKSTIASVKPMKNTIWCGKRDGKPVLFGQNIDQTEFDLTSEGVSSIQGVQNAQ